MPRGALFALMIGAVALSGPALAEKPAPADVKCGTPEWAPFREAVAGHCKKQSNKKERAHCTNTYARPFATCKGEEGDLEPIKGKEVAKGRVDYIVWWGPHDQHVLLVRTKGAWIVKRMWTGDAAKGME
jgi:hypothetical protein